MKSKLVLIALFSALLVMLSQTHASAQSSGGFAKTWGGSDADASWGVGFDKEGNTYVSGVFNGTVDLDPGPREEFRRSDGGADAFLSKLDSNGDLLWTRSWGGKAGVSCTELTIDNDGYIYVVGEFSDTIDFDPSTGQVKKKTMGHGDCYLLKFDSRGNLIWVYQWGGHDGDHVHDVAHDENGNAYVTGWFEGVNRVGFDRNNGPENRISNGMADVYLMKVNSNGQFSWARTWGGTLYEKAINLDLDKQGNIFVVGEYYSNGIDMDPGIGLDIRYSHGGSDAFLSKFDPDGDFQWCKTWGSQSNDTAHSVALDTSGNAYITGHFQEKADFDPGDDKVIKKSNGYSDAFLLKLTNDGNFGWVETWGGRNKDNTISVATYGSNTVYVQGRFSESVDFNPGGSSNTKVSAGKTDFFLCKYGADSSFKWVKTWGGEESEYAHYLTVDQNGNVYLTGWTDSKNLDYDPGPGEYRIPCMGKSDAFLIKVKPDGSW